MKAKHLCILSFLCLIIIFPQHGLIKASSYNMINEFKFYDIGAEDTKHTTAKKLDANRFKCGSGKATFLDFGDIQKQSINRKITEKIEEIIDMDKNFEDYGKRLSFMDMPINLIVCGPPEDSPFAFSTYYFSEFDQKILAVMIEIENYELVKDKLALKFGSCILDGYCESDKGILFLVNISGLRLQVYFYENLKSHYKKIKELKMINEKNTDERFDEAF